MNPLQRMAAVGRGEPVDRIPFLPTILEHSAAMTGKTPSEAAMDGKLLEEAQIKAYRHYGHDAVTVGIDIYNIEAEALGCKVRYHDNCSIPGILTHPFDDEFIPEYLPFSTEMGRINTLLTAASNVKSVISSEVNVGVAICGAFSVYMELKGYENAVFSLLTQGYAEHRLLAMLLDFQKKYCDEIIGRGLGITIFESWATPPLISPEMYREFVRPYEQELISHIKNRGLKAVPLVIGGDTTRIADDIIETGTTLLVADYSVDAAEYVEKAAEKNLMVRVNIDPKLVKNGTKEQIIGQAEAAVKKAGHYGKFVLGTGVIPYDTPPENILLIKSYLESL